MKKKRIKNLKENPDQMGLLEYDHVYECLHSMSLRELYYVMSILPEIFWHTYEDTTGVHYVDLACEYPTRLLAFTKCVSQLHQALGILKTSDLTRVAMYIERLTYKQRVTTDSEFLDNLLDKVLEDSIKPINDKYENEKER